MLADWAIRPASARIARLAAISRRIRAVTTGRSSCSSRALTNAIRSSTRPPYFPASRGTLTRLSDRLLAAAGIIGMIAPDGGVGGQHVFQRLALGELELGLVDVGEVHRERFPHADVRPDGLDLAEHAGRVIEGDMRRFLQARGSLVVDEGLPGGVRDDPAIRLIGGGLPGRWCLRRLRHRLVLVQPGVQERGQVIHAAIVSPQPARRTGWPPRHTPTARYSTPPTATPGSPHWPRTRRRTWRGPAPPSPPTPTSPSPSPRTASTGSRPSWATSRPRRVTSSSRDGRSRAAAAACTTPCTPAAAACSSPKPSCGPTPATAPGPPWPTPSTRSPSAGSSPTAAPPGTCHSCGRRKLRAPRR